MRQQMSKQPDWMQRAARRHGAVARRELICEGLSSSAIARRVEAGTLQTLYRGVYVVGGAPQTWTTRISGATLLAPQTVASHRAAARLWDIGGIRTNLIEVTTPARLRTPGITAHRHTLTDKDVTSHRGIPITSVHRTLSDLGAVVNPTILEDALDDALRKGLTSIDWLQKELERIGVHGKKGPAALSTLLAEADASMPSWLERRFIRKLKGTKIPPYQREYPALAAKYFIDFAWPDVCLGVEVHGEKWHKRRQRWPQDLARHNDITSAGWTMLHYAWEQIRDDGARIVREIWNSYTRLAGLDLSSR